MKIAVLLITISIFATVTRSATVYDNAKDDKDFQRFHRKILEVSSQEKQTRVSRFKAEEKNPKEKPPNTKDLTAAAPVRQALNNLPKFVQKQFLSKRKMGNSIGDTKNSDAISTDSDAENEPTYSNVSDDGKESSRYKSAETGEDDLFKEVVSSQSPLRISFSSEMSEELRKNRTAKSKYKAPRIQNSPVIAETRQPVKINTAKSIGDENYFFSPTFEMNAQGSERTTTEKMQDTNKLYTIKWPGEIPTERTTTVTTTLRTTTVKQAEINNINTSTTPVTDHDPKYNFKVHAPFPRISSTKAFSFLGAYEHDDYYDSYDDEEFESTTNEDSSTDSISVNVAFHTNKTKQAVNVKVMKGTIDKNKSNGMIENVDTSYRFEDPVSTQHKHHSNTSDFNIKELRKVLAEVNEMEKITVKADDTIARIHGYHSSHANNNNNNRTRISNSPVNRFYAISELKYNPNVSTIKNINNNLTRVISNNSAETISLPEQIVEQIMNDTTETRVFQLENSELAKKTAEHLDNLLYMENFTLNMNDTVRIGNEVVDLTKLMKEAKDDGDVVVMVVNKNNIVKLTPLRNFRPKATPSYKQEHKSLIRVMDIKKDKKTNQLTYKSFAFPESDDADYQNDEPIAEIEDKMKIYISAPFHPFQLKVDPVSNKKLEDYQSAATAYDPNIGSRFSDYGFVTDKIQELIVPGNDGKPTKKVLKCYNTFDGDVLKNTDIIRDTNYVNETAYICYQVYVTDDEGATNKPESEQEGVTETVTTKSKLDWQFSNNNNNNNKNDEAETAHFETTTVAEPSSSSLSNDEERRLIYGAHKNYQGSYPNPHPIMKFDAESGKQIFTYDTKSYYYPESGQYSSPSPSDYLYPGANAGYSESRAAAQVNKSDLFSFLDLPKDIHRKTFVILGKKVYSVVPLNNDKELPAPVYEPLKPILYPMLIPPSIMPEINVKSITPAMYSTTSSTNIPKPYVYSHTPQRPSSDPILVRKSENIPYGIKEDAYPHPNDVLGNRKDSFPVPGFIFKKPEPGSSSSTAQTQSTIDNESSKKRSHPIYVNIPLTMNNKPIIVPDYLKPLFHAAIQGDTESSGKKKGAVQIKDDDDDNNNDNDFKPQIEDDSKDWKYPFEKNAPVGEYIQSNRNKNHRVHSIRLKRKITNQEYEDNDILTNNDVANSRLLQDTRLPNDRGKIARTQNPIQFSTKFGPFLLSVRSNGSLKDESSNNIDPNTRRDGSNLNPNNDEKKTEVKNSTDTNRPGQSNRGISFARFIDDIFEIPMSVLRGVTRLLTNPFRRNEEKPAQQQ